MRRVHPLAWAAFVLAAFVLFARLGALTLIEPDEGRNAEVAREMMVSGSWLVPTYDGVPYLDKPAFYFREVALSMSAFGANETAARLPSAISALLLLVLVFFAIRAKTGERTAALAVIVIASTPLFFAFGRTVIFDMPLALFVSGSILAGALAEEREGWPRRLLYLAGAGCAAVATLIKGPAGFLVPSLVLIVFHFTHRRPGFFRRFFAPWNLALFFGLTLTWFLELAHRRPDFIGYGLLEESIRRYTTRSFHRTAPFYYYVPVLLATCFPWSLLAPEGMFRAARAWIRRRTPAGTRMRSPAGAGERDRPPTSLDRLWIVWGVVVVVFFSTSQSKLPGYVLTASVALGALVATIFSLAFAERRGGAGAVILHGSVALAAVSAVLALACVQNVIEPGRLQRIFHIRSVEFDRAQPLFLPVAVSLSLVTLAAIAACATRRIGIAFLAFLLFPILLVTACFPALRGYAEAASSEALASRVGEKAETIACIQTFPTGLPFYLKRPVILITRNGAELTSNYLLYMLRRGEPWPDVLVPYEVREDWLDARRGPVYLLATRKGRPALESMAVPRGAEIEEPLPGWWGALIPALEPWPSSPAAAGVGQLRMRAGTSGTRAS